MRRLLPLVALAACQPGGPRRPSAEGACAPGPSAALEQEVADLAAEAEVVGLSWCVVSEGALVACGASGHTSADQDRPVTPDTPFLLASVSKLATATAVLQLAEAGALDLDADLAEVLPFPLAHPTSSAPITARALLAHVGGVADNDALIDQWVGRGQDPSVGLTEAMAAAYDPAGPDYDADRNFTRAAPEASYAYSNTGYALLGAVVEAVTGEDFRDRSAETVFEPLGMSQTSWRLSDFELAELAEPTRATGSGYRALGHTTFVDYPNGGLRSSACDVARFLAATSTDGGGVLSAETLDLAQAVAFPALDDRQGLGWYREDLGERTLWIGHSGAEEGVATDAFARPDGSLGVVLLANGDWPRGDALLALEDALIAAYR